MHILLIEPDKLQAETYSSVLRQAGHTVAHATGAQSAVQQADTRMPDVVLLELQLPCHNGVEFLYEFRSYPEWLHVPVVLHTFVPPHELTQSATLQAELGVCKLLYKPATTLAALCAAVRAAVLPMAL